MRKTPDYSYASLGQRLKKEKIESMKRSGLSEWDIEQILMRHDFENIGESNHQSLKANEK